VRSGLDQPVSRCIETSRIGTDLPERRRHASPISRLAGRALVDQRGEGASSASARTPSLRRYATQSPPRTHATRPARAAGRSAAPRAARLRRREATRRGCRAALRPPRRAPRGPPRVRPRRARVPGCAGLRSRSRRRRAWRSPPPPSLRPLSCSCAVRRAVFGRHSCEKRRTP
jgi:hypothetical protein